MKIWRQAQSTDTASQTSWKTRWETRDQTGDKRNTSPARWTQHSRQGRPIKKAWRTPTANCPERKTSNKLGGKTGDKRKTRPGRRTQHLRPDGRQARRQEDKTKAKKHNKTFFRNSSSNYYKTEFLCRTSLQPFRPVVFWWWPNIRFPTNLRSFFWFQRPAEQFPPLRPIGRWPLRDERMNHGYPPGRVISLT